MEKVWSLCRFLGSVAYYYVAPTPPEYEIIRAHRCPNDGSDEEDITPKLLAWMAYASDDVPAPWGADRLLIEYKFKGDGPYAVYCDDKDQFVFPPENAGVKPVELCVISADVLYSDEEDEDDATDRAAMFAGPDGRWDGRLSLPGIDMKKSKFDPKLLLPPHDRRGKADITISFANGDDIELHVGQ
jgi:hypothetical protein